MRQVAGRTLWLGNPSDTRDPKTILDAGIEAVVELADNEPLAILPRELIRCRFPLSDGGENPDWLLRLASESVAAFLRAKVPVLVCCSGGMNRSVCIAAAGVALADGSPLREALIDIVQTGPADVSPRLLAELQQSLVVLQSDSEKGVLRS
ncbi:MAG: protein phosphatase [Schlesneria sp.]